MRRFPSGFLWFATQKIRRICTATQKSRTYFASTCRHDDSTKMRRLSRFKLHKSDDSPWCWCKRSSRGDKGSDNGNLLDHFVKIALDAHVVMRRSMVRHTKHTWCHSSPCSKVWRGVTDGHFGSGQNRQNNEHCLRAPSHRFFN